MTPLHRLVEWVFCRLGYVPASWYVAARREFSDQQEQLRRRVLLLERRLGVGLGQEDDTVRAANTDVTLVAIARLDVLCGQLDASWAGKTRSPPAGNG